MLCYLFLRLAGLSPYGGLLAALFISLIGFAPDTLRFTYLTTLLINLPVVVPRSSLPRLNFQPVLAPAPIKAQRAFLPSRDVLCLIYLLMICSSLSFLTGSQSLTKTGLWCSW